MAISCVCLPVPAFPARFRLPLYLTPLPMRFQACSGGLSAFWNAHTPCLASGRFWSSGAPAGQPEGAARAAAMVVQHPSAINSLKQAGEPPRSRLPHLQRIPERHTAGLGADDGADPHALGAVPTFVMVWSATPSSPVGSHPATPSRCQTFQTLLPGCRPFLVRL